MNKVFDVAIIGAGMAGLSAATYAAADGMEVALIEGTRAGGQAWHSPKIDNVVGIPGKSGALLSEQSLKHCLELGVDYHNTTVHKVESEAPGMPFYVTTQEGFTIDARTVVFATGKSWNKLEIPGMSESLVGKRVFYGEAARRGPRMFRHRPVAVIGGGNASAQSVLDLSLFCSDVHVIIRHKPTWSDYLHKQVLARKNVRLWPYYEVGIIREEEDGLFLGLKGVDEIASLDVEGLFILAGQTPNVELAKWAGLRTVKVNGEQRIETGKRRFALDLETSMAGIFAIGDCRDGMGHGIAAAMGDGNVVVNSIWRYLYDMDHARFQALAPALPPALLRPAPASPASDATPTQS